MAEHELMPAIALMERKVAEAERKVNELLSALNVLRVEAGLPPRPVGGGPSGGVENGALAQLKPDTFFGQKQQTAMRMYLDMRKAQGLGPARPRDIYEALVEGGYQFETKDAETALVGMRALLRKRSETFIKLPNGTYGLTGWYPNAKRPKSAPIVDSTDDGEPEDTGESPYEMAATPEPGAAA